MINATIDISHHNSFDADLVRNDGIVSVFQKATQGILYKDPTFSERKELCDAAGLLFGAYHFGTGSNVGGQVENLLSVTGRNALLVLDFERNPQGETMRLEQAEEFVRRVYTTTGRYPGLYVGGYAKEVLAANNVRAANQTELSNCWLWIAQYASRPIIPKVWSTWTFWQYTDGNSGPEPHEVDGIGPCDRDQFNGSFDQLCRFWETA